MKAFFIDGCMDGRSKDVSDDTTEITETRWQRASIYDSDYNKVYKATYYYKLDCIISPGKTVAYFRHVPIKPVQDNPLNNLKESALHRFGQQRSDNSFGGRFRQ